MQSHGPFYSAKLFWISQIRKQIILAKDVGQYLPLSHMSLLLKQFTACLRGFYNLFVTQFLMLKNDLVKLSKFCTSLPKRDKQIQVEKECFTIHSVWPINIPSSTTRNSYFSFLINFNYNQQLAYANWALI